MFEIEKITLLGTCGENISEMRRVCTLNDDIDIMESHLMFNHLAPSAPSSLFTAPSLTDLLVLKHLPNIYFSGGMTKFASKVLTLGKQSCKLLLIPHFAEGVVLLNNRTADCCLIDLC
jgi:DNA polymerase II small subunit/DNA polymerase delta subunit B